MDSQIIKDVLININNGKYSKDEILEAMAWGEKNTEIFFPILKEYMPEYYQDKYKTIGLGTPFKVITFLKDFGYIKI